MALVADHDKGDANATSFSEGVTLTSVASKQTKRIPQRAFEAFGRALEEYVRLRHGGNQSNAAKALGITQGHISAIIRGERGPGANAMIALRLATGKTIDEMLGFQAPPTEDLIERLRATFELQVARTEQVAREIREENEKLRKQLDDVPKQGPRSATTPRGSRS